MLPVSPYSYWPTSLCTASHDGPSAFRDRVIFLHYILFSLIFNTHTHKKINVYYNLKSQFNEIQNPVAGERPVGDHLVKGH